MIGDEYKAFYCRAADPGYVKLKKVDILVDIVNENNNGRILEEMAAYVTDIDINLARRAVRCVGKIAINLPTAFDHCTTVVCCLVLLFVDSIKLLAFLELQSTYVAAETIVALQDLLRKVKICNKRNHSCK